MKLTNDEFHREARRFGDHRSVWQIPFVAAKLARKERAQRQQAQELEFERRELATTRRMVESVIKENWLLKEEIRLLKLRVNFSNRDGRPS